jgi:hypothetical protein
MVLGTSVSLGTQDLLCRGLNDGSTLDAWQKLGAGRDDAWRPSSKGDAHIAADRRSVGLLVATPPFNRQCRACRSGLSSSPTRRSEAGPPIRPDTPKCRKPPYSVLSPATLRTWAIHSASSPASPDEHQAVANANVPSGCVVELDIHGGNELGAIGAPVNGPRPLNA